MPEYHRPWVVPVRHLVALFEVFNHLRALWAAQFHEEVVAAIHHVDHEGLHFLIVDLMRRDNQDETAATIRMRLCRGWPDGARA